MKVDSTPPKTKLKVKFKPGRAAARITSNEPNSTFECRLDRGKFRACKPRQKFKGLDAGKHVIQAIAIDPAGNSDATAARRKFKVKR